MSYGDYHVASILCINLLKSLISNYLSFRKHNQLYIMQIPLWACLGIAPIFTIFHCGRGLPIPQAEYPAFWKSQHMCGSFQSVLRKYPQWTLESLPSGQRKKKRSNRLLFSLIGWPHSLWNFGFSFTWFNFTGW